jgi:hypothetical protein
MWRRGQLGIHSGTEKEKSRELNWLQKSSFLLVLLALESAYGSDEIIVRAGAVMRSTLAPVFRASPNLVKAEDEYGICVIGV